MEALLFDLINQENHTIRVELDNSNLTIHEIKYATVFLRDFPEEPLENRPSSLNSCRGGRMPCNELSHIGHPDLIKTGPLEIGEGELEHSESLLEV